MAPLAQMRRVLQTLRGKTLKISEDLLFRSWEEVFEGDFTYTSSALFDGGMSDQVCLA
jgi:hypothetical protein